MPYVKFDTPSESNKVSPGGFIAYMEKEDLAKGIDKEFWFNAGEDNIPSYRVMENIESQKGLGKDDFRYYTGSINFSEEELAFLKNDYKKLKKFGKAFINEYAKNFNKSLSGSDVRFFLKLESDRYYKGTDSEVICGSTRSGEKKPGCNTHFHFIVGRKTIDDKKKISPLSNHINTKSGAVTGGFSRDQLKERTEHLFDKMFKYNRPLEQSYQYLRDVSPEKTLKQRVRAVNQSADKVQSMLRYNHLSREEKEKKLGVFINYMQHGQTHGAKISIDKNAVLKEAKSRKYNGDVYKALLNMNSRIKNGYDVSGDLTPYILNYAKFVEKPYSQLPDSLKEDRFMRFTQIINKHLPHDNKLDSFKLFELERQNNLNGKVYRAMGAFSKILSGKENVPNAQETIIELAKGKDNSPVSMKDTSVQKLNPSVPDITASSVTKGILGGNLSADSSSGYKEEKKPNKKKKRRPGLQI
ncbi:DUF5712 family protein [Marinilabilia salmonicolor]|uniref:Uncharacterized protein n=1 Tax=Marinilabilia salmonicolor TaxID=989 RepID=A0A368UIV5_9BACT|nr:DUF5712 family protein [Marinilabilia salmonicolor]RCW22475.1 hypothetical protein DFO77_1514 [Marinilabilia salmonicolor]